MRIFALFFLVVHFELHAWEFRIYYTSDIQPEVSVDAVEPFDLYASKIQMSFFRTEEIPCVFYSDNISIRYEQLKKVVGINNCVYIFVVPGNFRGRGGQLKKQNGEIVRYIFVRENCSGKEVCHELCHAIAGLGDEYGDTGNFPETMKKAEGKTMYPNLTWYKSDFKDWETIANAKEYVPGGAGYSGGVFHAYEKCLMKELSQPLCPICSFYLRQALDNDD